jgi:hypothetical protein
MWQVWRADKVYTWKDNLMLYNIIWILKNGDEETCTGLLWLRTGTGACECGNTPLGSIKRREFFD